MSNPLLTVATGSTGGTELLGVLLALVFVLALVGGAVLLVTRVLGTARDQDIERRVSALEREVESLRQRFDDE